MVNVVTICQHMMLSWYYWHYSLCYTSHPPDLFYNYKFVQAGRCQKGRKGLRWACLVSFPKFFSSHSPPYKRSEEQVGERSQECYSLEVPSYEKWEICYFLQDPSDCGSVKPLNLLFIKLFYGKFQTQESDNEFYHSVISILIPVPSDHIQLSAYPFIGILLFLFNLCILTFCWWYFLW